MSLTAQGPRAVAVRSAAEVLATRTFRGLDLSEGAARPLGVVQGRSGIASGYAHEPSAAARLPAGHVADAAARPPESIDSLYGGAGAASGEREGAGEGAGGARGAAGAGGGGADSPAVLDGGGGGVGGGVEGGAGGGEEDAMERAMQDKAGAVDAFFDAFFD